MKFNKEEVQELIKGTFIEVLGIAFQEDEDMDSLTATMVARSQLSQTMGILHGGVNIALAETVAGMGSNLLCAENEKCLGAQISANHMAGVDIGDTMIAKAQIIHQGKKTHVWTVNIFSEKTKKLVSTVNVMNAVVIKR